MTKFYIKDEETAIGESINERKLLAIDEKDIETIYPTEEFYIIKNNDGYELHTGEYFEEEQKKLEVLYKEDLCCEFDEQGEIIEKLENDENLEEFEIKIIEKSFESFGCEVEDLEEQKVFDWWDGSNWRTEVLESDWTEWVDYTEELEDMEKITSEKFNTYIEEIHKLKDGDEIKIINSFYQGTYLSIEWI